MSKLTDIIALLYRMDEDDTRKTARQLNERYRASWVNTLSDLAKKHGCSRLGQVPKGDDAKKFREDARRDAESITRTFNTQLENEIKRIIKDVPKANRNTIIKRLEAWKKKRDAYKTLDIGINTDGAARQYAFTRFYQENSQIRRAFIAAGPPPTCAKCIRIFAAGIVDFEYTQQHPLGLLCHYNCPHFYRSVAPQKVECSTLWLS